MKHVLLPALLVPALAACGPALTQLSPKSGVPSFYTPGRGATPEAGVDAAGAAADPAVAQDASAGVAAAQEPGLTWLQDPAPVAGPAPRNADSGGHLDFGVVPASPQGATRVGVAPTHGIEPTESGRLYILELYQEVLDQRDALELEVSTLTQRLEAAQAEAARLSGVAAGGEERAGALEQELAALRQENRDLAARLATAQIRRLEAEKVLLESKIELARRSLSGEAARAGGVARQGG